MNQIWVESHRSMEITTTRVTEKYYFVATIRPAEERFIATIMDRRSNMYPTKYVGLSVSECTSIGSYCTMKEVIRKKDRHILVQRC